MENVVCSKKEYSVLSEIKADPQCIHYLVERENVKYDLYKYSLESLFKSSLKRRKLLKRYFSYVPKIVEKDKKNCILLIEHMEEETVLDLLVKGDLADDIYKQMFDMYRTCRVAKMDLNYLPEYYVVRNNHLYYVSDDMFDRSEKTCFENFGVYYWVYSPDFVTYLKDKGLPVDTKRILDKAHMNKKIVLLSVLNW